MEQLGIVGSNYRETFGVRAEDTIGAGPNDPRPLPQHRPILSRYTGSRTGKMR